MGMQIVEVEQKTQAWLDLRRGYRTASEAPMVMGVSRHKTRADLMREKATGTSPDVTPFQQRLFDRGAAAEEAARPFVEAQLGTDLFPVTCVNGSYLASLDGMDMAGSIIWEHKLLNSAIAASISPDATVAKAALQMMAIDAEMADSLATGTVPEEYTWQLEHQLMVTGAERAIFSASNGTEASLISVQYRSDPAKRAALVAAWDQFKRDLDDYTPTEIPVQVKAAPIETLPALTIDLIGSVRESNLTRFRNSAMARIAAIKTDLQTDEDFATAEATVVFLGKAEKEIDAAKARALSQTTSIEDLFLALDNLRETMRAKRLELDKLVKARKVTVRGEIIAAANERIKLFLVETNATIARAPITDNWITSLQDAAKGKRSLKGLSDAVDQATANAKIAITERANAIRTNLAHFDTVANGRSSLFADLADLAHQAPENFRARVDGRIAEAVAEEQRRENARIERERIEAERAEVERITRETAEANARIAREQQAERKVPKISELPVEPEKPVEQVWSDDSPKPPQTWTAPRIDELKPAPRRIDVSRSGDMIQLNLGGFSYVVSFAEAQTLRNDLDKLLGK